MLDKTSRDRMAENYDKIYSELTDEIAHARAMGRSLTADELEGKRNRTGEFFWNNFPEIFPPAEAKLRRKIDAQKAETKKILERVS